MPKRVPPISARTLNGLRPGETPIELVDGLVPGLRVRVLPSGLQSWSLNIRDNEGIRRRFKVGVNLGLAEARRKAEKVVAAIRDGQDPTRERRLKRRRAEAAREGIGTLEALLDTYFTTGPGSAQRRALRSLRLAKTVFSDHLRAPALDIGRISLQVTADRWGSPASASLAVRIIRPCLKWAERRGFVPQGVHDLEPPQPSRKRERVVTADELKSILANLSGTHGDVIRWLLWTGCRLTEATGMSWGEIKGDLWTIPAGRAKNGRERTIPLPRQALSFLEKRDRGEDGALVLPSSRGGVLSNWDRETKKLQAASKTSDWHRHDLRRTVATMLGDLGFPPHVISVVLGHVNIAEGATAVYARSRYQQEHREALQSLASEIDRLVTCGGNVVRLFPSNPSASPQMISRKF